MDFLSSMLWPEDGDGEKNPAAIDLPVTPLEDEKKEEKMKQSDKSHPYPVSISIQMNDDLSESSDYHEQWRSPSTLPGDRGRRRGERAKESRQPNSPVRNSNTEVTDLQKHHENGRKQFLCNHLAEAVDSYTHAINVGLEEMAHRKERDISTLELVESVAQVHLDLAFALEVAGKYSESAEELSSGRDMLRQASSKNKDNRIRECMENIKRMKRAVAVEEDRKKQRSRMESALKKLEGCSSEGEKEAARKKAIGTIKQVLWIERDSLGEQSYAVSKLKLKIAKVRYEGNDLEGSLEDADAAIKNLEHILGAKHTLVGAACLFAATVNEKLVSILSKTEVTDPKPITKAMTKECKSKIKRALKLYTEALEPLKFKYSCANNQKVRAELGDVFLRMGRLYGKEGSYMSAVDAYQHSLEVFGAAAMSKNEEFCPEAVTVWYSIGELHLSMNKFDDAVYAARKCTELAKMLPKSSSSENIVSVSISSLQIIGDAYVSMNRLGDATRSYQEALNAFRNARSNSRMKNSFTSMEEAKIMKKIGNSLLHENKPSKAKIVLLDALQCLRSDKRGANSLELPMLLSNIGHAHIRCGEYLEAKKVLRSCLKSYSDQGVSSRSPEVTSAKQLYKEAELGPDHHFESSGETYAPTLSPGRSPQRTVTTQSTVPSSVYSSNLSSGVHSGSTLNSIHGQLQKLLEQLQPGLNNTSPNGNRHPSELPLGEVETVIKRLQAKVQPKEYESERALDSVDRRLLSADVSPVAEYTATLDRQLQSMQKEVKPSYQQMLEVVEETKVTHEIEKKKLEREIMRLRQQQKEVAATSSSEEIILLRQEIHRLKELNKSASEEVTLLKSTNSTLHAGNDAAMSEIDSLNEEIDRLKNEVHRRSNESVAELKKMEYELKQERSRRMILEATIEKDYDNRGGGGFAYHPMMPFGYPMQVGADKNLKALEIDLATERANKEMLEDIVKDMTETHKQEVNELSTQIRNLPNLVLQLEAYESQNAALSKELSEAKMEKDSVQVQRDDALNELSTVKERFLQASIDLSALLEEKSALSDAHNEDRDALEFTKKELAKAQATLTTAQADLKAEMEVSRTITAKKDQLQEDHDCLKKEFKEAIALFQTEIEEARKVKEEELDEIKMDQTSKDKELDDTRQHLKDALAELEEVQDSRDTLQAEVKTLENVLENTRHQLEVNTEELLKATAEVDALRASYEEAESARSNLEQSQAQQQSDHDKSRSKMESSLRVAEQTVKELEESQRNLQSRLSKSKEQVKSALQVLKKVSASLDIAEVEQSRNVDEDTLLQVISSNIESAVEAKNKEVKAATWNLTNTINELDILEKKHQELKDELTEISDLRSEHNDLLQEFEQLSKELLEVNVEKEEAQERCDLHKSRLKDAVDDLEELEYERDELKEELDQTIEDSGRLEMSLRDMIGALEDENERLKKYESATVDFDAVVWEKDQKLKILKEELHAAHSQLTILRASTTSKPKEIKEEIYPDILPDTQNAMEEVASLRSVIHSLEERNLELSEKLAKSEGLVDSGKDETGFDGSELETLKLRVSELSEQKEKLEQELSKVRTYVDEVEMHRESDAVQENLATLNDQVNQLTQQLHESQKEVVSAANIHDNDVEVIASLHDSLEEKEKQYMDEVAKLEEQVATLSDVNNSLEDRLRNNGSSADTEQCEEVMRADTLALKAQIRGLEQENKKLSLLLAEAQAETIDASRTHADDQETIFELKNELKEKEELLQSTHQGTSNHSDASHQEELKQWITRVDTLENELSDLRNQESECDECEQRNQQLANVIETLNDLQVENQGLKTEILLWETADDDGKGLGQKVNFEKEMNAAHSRFVSMEKSLQETIKRLEKEKETLVAAHVSEITNHTRQHDKTRIELSAWKLEMQNALNDIESLKRENDDLRNAFNAVSQKANSSQANVETVSV